MATLILMGFSHAPPHKTEDGLAPSSTGLLRQWDIVAALGDRADPGRLGGRRARDEYHPNAGQGRLLFFVLHVPAISRTMADVLRSGIRVWPSCGREVAERMDASENEREPMEEAQRGYYVEFSALPEWAQVGLVAEGEATLGEYDARKAIRHKQDPTLVAQLFTRWTGDAE